MAKRSALGKGLGAFFGDDVVNSVSEIRNDKETTDYKYNKSGESEDSSVSKKDGNENKSGRTQDGFQELHEKIDNLGFNANGETLEKQTDVSRETLVKLTDIEPNMEQPRKKFEEESLQELADSMKEYGVLQPLLVKKIGDTYQIIAGERRWRA